MQERDFISTAGWTLDGLLVAGQRFREVPRISIDSDDLQSVLDEHERSGVPLIIEGLHNRPEWPRDLFNPDWFSAHGQQKLRARNVCDRTDQETSLSTFLTRACAESPYATRNETQRLYAKDVECPVEWKDWIDKGGVIPSSCCPYSSKDILQHMPASACVETLMCYLGIGDTYTPCHKDLCASSGQNLMCYTENNASAFWFMTQSCSAPAVAEYFHTLKQDLDLESYTITVAEMAKAPFDVYIAEQKLGDFVLVPPRSCHQVVNSGGLTIKMSWSRMTIKGAETALYHELPIYRRQVDHVCRMETYRVKSTIHHALLHRVDQLERFLTRPGHSESDSTGLVKCPKHILDCAEEARSLLAMFDDILISDFSPQHASFEHLITEFVSSIYKTDTNMHHICDFCGADIFQSFFECRNCVQDVDPPVSLGDGLHVCPGCYAEGRTCRCGSMEPVQCCPFNAIVDDRNRAVKALAQVHVKYRDLAVLESINDLLSEGLISLFASCLEIRQWHINERSFMCGNRRKDGDPNHQHDIVCSLSTLNCKQCHRATCLRHLLSQGIHSSQAIIAVLRDKEHRHWHKGHRLLREAFPSAKKSILDAELSGDACSYIYGHRLALAAITFPKCQPINPVFIKLGWYDEIHASPIIAGPISMDTSPIERNQDWGSSEASSPLSDPDTMSDNRTLVHGTTVKTGIDSISGASRPKAKQTPQSSADPEQTNKRKRKAAADGVEPARSERKRRTNPRASDVVATRNAGPIASSVVEEQHEARRTADGLPMYIDKLTEKVEDLEALVEHQNKELRALRNQLSRMDKSYSENFHKLLKLNEDRQDAPPMTNGQQPRAPPPRTLGQFTPHYHSDRGGPNWQPFADDQSVYAFDGSPQRYAQRQSPNDNHQHLNASEPLDLMRAPPHPFPNRGRGFGRGRGRGGFRQQPQPPPYHQDLAHAGPDPAYRARPSRRGYGDSSQTPPRLPYSQYSGLPEVGFGR